MIAIRNVHSGNLDLLVNSPLILNKNSLRKYNKSYPVYLDKYAIATINIASSKIQGRTIYPSDRILTLTDKLLKFFSERNNGIIDLRSLNIAIHLVLNIYKDSLYRIDRAGDLEDYKVIADSLIFTRQLLGVYQILKERYRFIKLENLIRNAVKHVRSI